jgi:glycosyltransferase involved in cell wall biosynthesis
MRVLVLNYEFPPLGGGASPVSYEISKGYVKLGHSVSVVTMGYKGLKKHEVLDGIDVYRVPCLRSKKEICHPWEQLTYIISAKKFLRKHLKENKYDVCHCHFIIPTGVVALWVKKKFGIEYIITSHGSDVLGYNNKRSFKYIYPLVKNQWKEIVREAKVVICPSEFLKGKIKNLTKEGNLKVIPNGIDTNKFKPMKKENKILIVARLFENKGVQDVLDALKGMDLKGWKIDIVGDGPYSNFLKKKCIANGLSNIVEFHGWVENNSTQMKNLYGKAKIFISASWFENMSIVLLEALSAGCNVIATNVGGNPEVVSKEGLFEVGNIERLKEKLRVAMFEKSISSNLRRFDWNEIVKKYGGVL